MSRPATILTCLCKTLEQAVMLIVSTIQHCRSGMDQVFRLVFTEKLGEDVINIFTAVNSAYYVDCYLKLILTKGDLSHGKKTRHD